MLEGKNLPYRLQPVYHKLLGGEEEVPDGCYAEAGKKSPHHTGPILHQLQ